MQSESSQYKRDDSPEILRVGGFWWSKVRLIVGQPPSLLASGSAPRLNKYPGMHAVDILNIFWLSLLMLIFSSVLSEREWFAIFDL